MLFLTWERGVVTTNHIGLVVVLFLGLRMGNWVGINGHRKIHHAIDPVAGITVAIGASAVLMRPRPMIGSRHGNETCKNPIGMKSLRGSLIPWQLISRMRRRKALRRKSPNQILTLPHSHQSSPGLSTHCTTLANPMISTGLSFSIRHPSW